MKYISTQGQTPPQSFEDILLMGLAPDGGLFMPEFWPQISPGIQADFQGAHYTEVAHTILSHFVGDDISTSDLRADIEDAYAKFDDPRIAPLVEIAPQRYILELFHGPTLAFKDMAMQVRGRLFARALKKRGGRATVLAATSGDTGAAAIAALGGLENISVIVLHPNGRVSEVQRRQMTTSKFGNVHNIALDGTFDDAQSIVKSLFTEEDFANTVNLTAVNSINFARIAAQSVYYFTAAAALGVPASFVVPTGNFGDIFAGEAAARMGLPVQRLIAATNTNAIMVRALNEGYYEAGSAQHTISPSMDIQVASNFERALFEVSNRDIIGIRRAMGMFAKHHKLSLSPAWRTALRARYGAGSADDEETLATMARIFSETGRLIDPHTAVAVAVANKTQTDGPVVMLSTAHPAKFPDAVAKATGRTPALPQCLGGLYEGAERMTVLPNDKTAIRQFIEDHAAA